MSTTDSNERRRFSRVPFQSDVLLTIQPAKEAINARLLDISLKGALVEVAQSSAKSLRGEICNISLLLGNDGERIEMDGKIVHQKDSLIGIECQHIDLASITNLRQLIEFNRGDKELIEKELAEMIKMALAASDHEQGATGL